MQPGVTVALAMVWLTQVVGVLSTSILLHPTADQYTPQLPEYRYGVARGPQELAIRNHWHTLRDLFNLPIHPNLNNLSSAKSIESNLASNILYDDALQDLYQKEGPESIEVHNLDLPNEKLPASDTKSLKRFSTRTESDTPTPKSSAENILNADLTEKVSNIDEPSPNSVPELQIGCEGVEAHERHKRSESSSTESYLVPDVSPLLLNTTPIVLDLDEEDREEGQFYEEMDELLRLRQKEKDATKSTVRQIRGDIQVSMDESDETAEASDIPLRGDIGAANALARASSSGILKHKEADSDEQRLGDSRARRIDVPATGDSTSASLADASASNGGRRLVSLRKREAIDFPEKVESPWGYGEQEGVDPSQERRLKKVKRRKKTGNKSQKRNREDKRWKTVNRNHKKILTTYSRENTRARMEEARLQQKLNDYIRRNTPIDVRRNDPRYLPFTRTNSRYDPRNRSRNDERYRYSHVNSDPQRRPTTSTHQDRRYDNVKSQRNYHDRSDPRSKDPRWLAYEQQRYHLYQPAADSNRRRMEDSNRNSPMDIRINSPEDDYIRRNTPIDVRRRPNYNRTRPYQPRFDTSRSEAGNFPERTSDDQQRRGHNSPAPVDTGSRRRYETARSDPRQSNRSRYKGPDENSQYWQRREKPPQSQIERIGQEDRWKVSHTPQYEYGRPRNQIEQERSQRERQQEQQRRYEEYKRKSSPQDMSRLHGLPVDAKIIIQTQTPAFDTRRSGGRRHPTVVNPTYRAKRNVSYSRIDPQHRGPVAVNFPSPQTQKPPVQSPPLCVWAIVKCCQNPDRRKACFDGHGCPGIHWDPDPCRKAVLDDARAEIQRFYASTEG